MEPQLIWGNVKISLNDLPEEAWDYIVGGDEGQSDLRKYYKAVAWLNRGVKIRANHLTRVPFSIYKGETEIDTSEDWQNKLQFTKDLKRLLWITEAGLTLSGKCYWRISRGAFGGRGIPMELHNMMASTITPIYNTEGRDESLPFGALLYFERDIGQGGIQHLDVDDVVYFWAPDDSVEIGPPQDYPALASLQAAGVLHAVANFANMFFERGAIKVTLLTTKGHVVEAERSRLKTWWNRIRGNAWASEVMNADQVEAVPIGEGLESLDNTELTKEQREDIATALGVPHSMLFSNAANYATSVQDKQNFYEDTIIPECELIQEVVNEQLLGDLGYRLVFDPQAMAIFQEDEEQRAQAFANYIAAGIKPSIIGEMLGLDLPDGVEYSELDEKYERSLEMGDMLAEQGGFGGREDEEEDDEDEEEMNQPRNMMEIDLDKWHRRSLNRIKSGKAVCDRPFESEHIPAVILGAIEGALQAAQTAEDIDAVFSDPWIKAGYP